MRNVFSGLIACLLLVLSCASPVPPESPRNIVFKKNYPLTYALEQNPSVVQADPTLQALAHQKYEVLSGVVDGWEAVQLSRFSEDEIALSAARLGALADKLSALVRHLRIKGSYYIFNDLPDDAFLEAAWKQDAEGMNHVLDVHALGKMPRYPAIDRITTSPDDTEMAYVRNLAWSNVLSAAKDRPFYAITLESALAWLDANGRFEAADFEPMESGINSKAYKAIGKTHWDQYPYSVILVLGCGPEREGEAISPQSRLRAWYGAQLYREGKAPFIVVSGGRVHPFKTPYSEAEEMKQYLMEVCGIPEEAIIAEPHARHTTTNIRNTARIMLSQGIPPTMSGIITSGREHIDYVTGEGFLDNCRREMLTVPFTLGTRLSLREVTFYPLPSAYQVAPLDPLDP